MFDWFFSFRKWLTKKKQLRPVVTRARLSVEELEKRLAPAWLADGPAPQINVPTNGATPAVI